MALKLAERYLGRATEPTIDYPTGSFKNKSSPVATDGTPLEKDFANDWLGARDAILKRADITASGNVETSEVSDVLNALEAIIQDYTPQATETVAGIAEVATQAETDAGTLDNRFVTPKKLRWGFLISLTTNGYIAFPSWLGGPIMQWGKVSDISYTAPSNGNYPIIFPLSFPNQCFFGAAIPTIANGSGGGSSFTTEQISETGLRLTYSSSTSFSGFNFNWFSIGY